MKSKILGLVATLYAVAAHAVPTAGVSISAPQYFDGDGPWSLGYAFQARSNITVTALGAFDIDGNGFLNDHPVGLWMLDGTLLGSTTVSSASSLIDGFRYNNVGGIALTAGQLYVVGAADFGGVGQDSYAFGATVIEALDVDYVRGRYSFGSGLLFPFNNAGAGDYFGGNFLYEATVTEPGTLALLGLGLLGLGVTRRRKLN